MVGILKIMKKKLWVKSILTVCLLDVSFSYAGEFYTIIGPDGRPIVVQQPSQPKSKKIEVKEELLKIIGPTTMDGYVNRVKSALSALPQEIRIILRKSSEPIVFESVEETSNFIKDPNFNIEVTEQSFVYEVTYSDGTEFAKELDTLEQLKKLHEEIEMLENHMISLNLKT